MRWKLGGTELAGFRIEFNIAGKHVSDSGFARTVKFSLIKTLVNIMFDLRGRFLLGDQFSDAQHHRQNCSAAFRIPAGWMNAPLTTLCAVAIDQTIEAVSPGARFFVTLLTKRVHGGAVTQMNRSGFKGELNFLFAR